MRYSVVPVLASVLACAVAQPALAQSRIQVGQTISGELSASDARLDDGSYFDCYDLQTQRGQRLQIDQTAGLFDSFLTAVRGGCSNPSAVIARDDDSGGGFNARIVHDGDGEVWGLVVNSIESNVTGGYQLRVTALQAGQSAGATIGSGALPRVTSDWETDAVTCHSAYTAMVELRGQGVAPDQHGNVRGIDYGARANSLSGRLDDFERDSAPTYVLNFQMMANIGALGVAPNGQPNGHRPLAEYLTALANCDRAFNFSPVTAY